MAKVLIVDDEQSIRRTLRDILEFEKYQVDEAANGVEALVQLKKAKYDILIMDIKMPKMDGMEALERINILAPDTPVVMISGHGTIETAVEAVKKGAFDYIAKPPDLNRLLITIRNAMDKSNLITETKVLKRRVSKSKTQEIIGESKAITEVKEKIDKAATHPFEPRVLILGPNGSGKELVARWIHEKSKRASGPIVEVNCAAIPSELIESELFGHEKGSFTSAIKQRIGKFEQANGGTLFLDEIGDMDPSAQAKVLRALEAKKITRVGGDKEINVDVRVISATNKDLLAEIDDKNFRLDLYHRLAAVNIIVPPLKDRKEDIPILTNYFMKSICSEAGVTPKKITAPALKLLSELEWTGNIRELRNVVERLIIFSDKEITEKDVVDHVTTTSSSRKSLSDLFKKYDNLEDVQKHVAEDYKKFKAKK